MRRDEPDAVFLPEALVERIAVIRAVANHSFWLGLGEALLDGSFDQFRFMRRSAGNAAGDRKTMGSAIAMILLPFHRRVGPIAAPPFRRAEAGVDEGLGEIEFAARSQIFGQRVQQPSESAIALPLLKTTVAGLIGRIAVGQIVPRSADAQNPENAVQHGSRIAPGPTVMTIGDAAWE